MATVAKRQTKVKKALRARGITYGDVARLTGVSWSMVYQVLAGYRKSARVMAAIQKLLGNGQAAASSRPQTVRPDGIPRAEVHSLHPD